MNIRELKTGITSTKEGAIRTNTFRWILEEFFKNQRPGKKLVDLGAGPCLFSSIALGAGFDVTAVDGRNERLPDDMSNINFVLSDVREYDITEYDVVLVFGLLYHLTLEDQIELLSRCPKKATVIIDTQVHIPELVQIEACRARGFDISKVEHSMGYAGVLFPEAQNPMASIGNELSWWHTEPSLLKLFEQTGFNDVVKMEPAYVSKYGARKFYICTK